VKQLGNLKMMKIVNIIDSTPLIMEVPGDYIRCSISGEFRPRDEFCNDAGVQTRTNCTSTYLSKYTDNAVLSARTADIMCSMPFKSLVKQLQRSRELEANSIHIADMIATLLDLQSKNPQTRLVITQSGYYAEGGLADIYVAPELINKGPACGDVDYYSLGDSTQNY
jgi:hypothetical protein